MQTAMVEALRGAIDALEEARGHRAVVYFKPTLEDDDVVPIYECLQMFESLTTQNTLDLVLYTGGGSVSAARRVALLLHEKGASVVALVPYMSRSAGTLLCLSADEIIMSDLAELSPVDPHLLAASATAPSAPAAISAEDIRLFKEMAEQWFGVRGDENGLALLRLLCDRVFPTTLSAFFRAERQVQDFASELLSLSAPSITADERSRIVTQLLSGYQTHEVAITRNDAQKIGLRVRAPSRDEEAVMWRVWRSGSALVGESGMPDDADGSIQSPDGLIASSRFATQRIQQIAPLPAGRNGGLPIQQQPLFQQHHWSRLW